MRRALNGVETFFTVSAGEAADRARQHAAAVDAAVAAGVEHIAYLSFINATQEATFTFANDHWHTEEHVRAVGLRHTFLRDNMYLDVLSDTVVHLTGHAPITSADSLSRHPKIYRHLLGN